MADLKPPLQGYSLWFMAEPADRERLQILVDQLAQRHGTRRFEAHATALGLLDKTKKDLDHIVDNLPITSVYQRPFSVEVIGVGMRDMHFQALFLPIAPQPMLMHLHELARRMFGHQSDPPYMPHFSAVYGDLDWAAKREIATDIHQLLRFPLKITIDRIALVDVTGYPDEWRIIKEFLFNGQ